MKSNTSDPLEILRIRLPRATDIAAPGTESLYMQVPLFDAVSIPWALIDELLHTVMLKVYHNA
jgi:hypothetical protein